jgi:hypothetical protein
MGVHLVEVKVVVGVHLVESIAWRKVKHVLLELERLELGAQVVVELVSPAHLLVIP